MSSSPSQSNPPVAARPMRRQWRASCPLPLAARLARARLLYLRRREHFANWLALLVLLSLGVV